jgi:hypothetical protein
VFWGGWSPTLLGSETPTPVWPQAVLDDLRPSRFPDGRKGYFRQSSDQIGVTVSNDFIFGDLQHAMRKQLFDGISTITDAIDLATLPDHPAVVYSDTPVTLDDLAALLGVPLPSPLLTNPAQRWNRSSAIPQSSKRHWPCKDYRATPGSSRSTSSAQCR